MKELNKENDWIYQKPAKNCFERTVEKFETAAKNAMAIRKGCIDPPYLNNPYTNVDEVIQELRLLVLKS